MATDSGLIGPEGLKIGPKCLFARVLLTDEGFADRLTDISPNFSLYAQVA